jgi:hypothetical protein
MWNGRKFSFIVFQETGGISWFRVVGRERDKIRFFVSNVSAGNVNTVSRATRRPRATGCAGLFWNITPCSLAEVHPVSEKSVFWRIGTRWEPKSPSSASFLNTWFARTLTIGFRLKVKICVCDTPAEVQLLMTFRQAQIICWNAFNAYRLKEVLPLRLSLKNKYKIDWDSVQSDGYRRKYGLTGELHCKLRVSCRRMGWEDRVLWLRSNNMDKQQQWCDIHVKFA